MEKFSSLFGCFKKKEDSNVIKTIKNKPAAIRSNKMVCQRCGTQYDHAETKGNMTYTDPESKSKGTPK